MSERPILRLPEPVLSRRLTGKPAFPPRPRGSGAQGQAARFRQEIDRLQEAIEGPNAEVSLRQDPNGIAPERALVFVTAVPIQNFIKVATAIGLEVFSETEQDDYVLPDDLLDANAENANPTLYATMPTLAVLQRLLRLWRSYQNGEDAPVGSAPWWSLFDLLAELRPWGPHDRLTSEARAELSSRLMNDVEADVRVECEIWPTASAEKRGSWRLEVERNIVRLDGRIISRSTISEIGFVYDALLVELPLASLQHMIDNPESPDSLAMLDGIQFITPQTIAQSLPDSSEPLEDQDLEPITAFDDEAPFRVILLDGTPIAAHEQLDGGVSIEDVHDLDGLSQVINRSHATSMASLILRGDLKVDGRPVPDSRLLSIPLLIDTDQGASSPHDRLFVDLVHIALQRAFRGNEPLAPDAFVVNFSIGVVGSSFAGRISSLARLLDWWAETEGILFVISAGNVAERLRVDGTTMLRFEDTTDEDRETQIYSAFNTFQHSRSLLAPAEAINALTVGAVSEDLCGPEFNTPNGELTLGGDGSGHCAISSANGLGAFRSIKPDIVTIGGLHNFRVDPDDDGIRLRIAATNRTGLNVASSKSGISGLKRERGTSCANALATRSILKAAASLTSEDGPYDGQELPRRDLALLTKALTVSAARWPDAALSLFDRVKVNGGHHSTHKEAVARYFGHGLVDEQIMLEAPLLGSTLVGLGTLRKDQATIFDLPLPPSLAGEKVPRSMIVTLAWFSPVEPARARYRLAALEAVAADANSHLASEKDAGWSLSMKSGHLDHNLIKRGTVWSYRLITKNLHVPNYDDEAILPIRVQCRDASGGGLSPDEDIRFAIAVTLETETETEFDIHQEIRERLEVGVIAP